MVVWANQFMACKLRHGAPWGPLAPTPMSAVTAALLPTPRAPTALPAEPVRSDDDAYRAVDGPSTTVRAEPDPAPAATLASRGHGPSGDTREPRISPTATLASRRSALPA